jgi:uncharacterized UPF0160 family protein
MVGYRLAQMSDFSVEGVIFCHLGALIGLWDSREALEAALPRLEPARELLWEESEEDPIL